MKKMFKFTSLFMAAVMLVLAVMPLTAFAAQSTNQTYTVANYTIHNTADNGGYTPAGSNKVSSFSTGHTRLGTLKVSGNVAKKSYNGYEAYAVYGGSVSFTYKQTWSDKSNGGYDWKLSSDSYTSINGVSTGTIGDGGIIIMKSTNDGASWSLAAKSVGINGDTITFTPDGKDIQTGVLYKFISVCETYYTYVSGRHKDWKFWPFTYDWVDEYSNHYENLMQQTIVYLASDSAQIGFYSGATDNYDVLANFDDVSAETLEVLKKGTTLSHNSVSLDYIRVDKLGNKSFSVTCSYNNSEYFKVADGDKFTNPGRYHFVITTKFLTQRELDIYILDPGDDYAYNQYFGSGFVSQSMRMYDKNSQIPVYMVGTMLTVSPAANLPGLYGNIYRYENAKALEADEYTIVHTFNAQTTAQNIMLGETGIYCADLYAGDPNSGGEIIHYGFYLVISDNADYAPTVNLEMLTSADRHVMLKTATYVVSFPTAGGGSYLFQFENTLEGYEAALKFAEQIEYRFIEEYEENGVKYYYYKSPTSNVKDRYNKVDLYAEVQKNYLNNVNLIYSTNTDSYATMTIDEAIENVENTSIRNDVKVCVDFETRNKLVSSDVIVNGYKFYQAAEYESARLTATSESGEVYQIPYGVSAEYVFPHTGVYKITESNWCNTVEYYVTYIAAGEVTGVIDFNATKNFSDFSGKISSASTSVIDANSITLISGIDKYDSQTIVTVTKNGERKSMLITEVNGYTIEEPGTYEIAITNRCGHTTNTTVIITEAPKTAVKFEGYAQYNYEIKYGEILGELPKVNRYGYDFLGWTVNGKSVTANTVCEWKYNVTLTPVFEAKTVEIILNSYNNLETFKAEFGTKVSLSKMDGVEGYFEFAYWELNGKRVEELEITELGTVVLAAKYYEIDDTNKVITTATYGASELSEMIVNRRAEEAKRAADEEAARAKAEAEAEAAKKIAEAEAEAAKKVAEAEAEANKNANAAETEKAADTTDVNPINNGAAGSRYDDNTNHEYAKNSYINDVNDYNATYNNAEAGVNWTVILIVVIIAVAVVAIVVIVFKMYCI